MQRGQQALPGVLGDPEGVEVCIPSVELYGSSGADGEVALFHLPAGRAEMVTKVRQPRLVPTTLGLVLSAVKVCRTVPCSSKLKQDEPARSTVQEGVVRAPGGGDVPGDCPGVG